MMRSDDPHNYRLQHGNFDGCRWMSSRIHFGHAFHSFCYCEHRVHHFYYHLCADDVVVLSSFSFVFLLCSRSKMSNAMSRLYDHLISCSCADDDDVAFSWIVCPAYQFPPFVY